MTELLAEFSPSAYMTDTQVSRLKWMPCDRHIHRHHILLWKQGFLWGKYSRFASHRESVAALTRAVPARDGASRARLSLSRLNHWLPGCEAYPEVMQGTAQFHHEIADALLPQADPVFDDATALDTTVDMLDPQPTLVQRLVGPCCSRVSSSPWGFLVGMRISTWGSVKARKPRSCNNRLPAGKG